MKRFLLRRVVMLGVVLWGVATIAFVLMHLSGDPVSLMLSPDAPAGTREAMRANLGLDQPLPAQYARFLAGAVRGDFGLSIRQGVPAFDLVIDRLPATLELAAKAMVFGVTLGVPLGIFAATRRKTFAEPAIMGVALVGQSVPSFWLGLMLILFFGVTLQVLPISGRGEFNQSILPAVALGVDVMARVTRLLRSSLLEQLSEDYVRTARAKGLSGVNVVTRHVLRNAALPVVTLIGLDFGRLLAGAVIVETVFAWPGVGQLAVRAVFQRDFPVVQAVVFVMGVIFVAINLLLDVVYVWLDPRIRYS